MNNTICEKDIAERMGLKASEIVALLTSEGISPCGQDASGAHVYDKDTILAWSLRGGLEGDMPLRTASDWGAAIMAAAEFGRNRAGSVLLAHVEARLRAGESVYLPGGWLERVLRPPRKVFSRLSGKTSSISSRYGLRFRVSGKRSAKVLSGLN